MFGPATAFEAVKGGFMGFDAEAFGRWKGQFLDDSWDRHFQEPVVELVLLVIGE